jgi:predicted Rossmann fold nucleotide-binding protein DprA/Smf involved in DNA uptake
MSERARIAIIGSRRFPSAQVVKAFVAKLPDDSVVVSGGAAGVDTWAEEAARDRGLQTLVLHADWDGLGREAGPIRNAEIIANADTVVAFWDGKSRGTLNTLVQAREAGLPITILDPNGAAIPIETVMQAAEASGVLASIERAKRKGHGKR